MTTESFATVDLWRLFSNDATTDAVLAATKRMGLMWPKDRPTPRTWTELMAAMALDPELLPELQPFAPLTPVLTAKLLKAAGMKEKPAVYAAWMGTVMLRSILWVEHGCPVFDVDLDLATALVLTEPPQFEVKFPFPSFLIRLPPELGLELGVSDFAPSAQEAVRYASRRVTRVWVTVQPTGENGAERTHMHCHNSGNLGWQDTFQLEVNETNKRMTTTRLVLNLCAWMVATKQKPEPANPGFRTPKTKRYRVTRLADTDEAIRHLGAQVRNASTAGGGGETGPRVRHVVRGHWRSVPYGPRSVPLEQRPRHARWIKPFWRGKGGTQTAVTYKVHP